MNAKAEDIADLAKRGELPVDVKAVAEPVSPKAKQDAEDARRLKTVRQILGDAAKRALEKRSEQRIITTGHWRLDRDTGGFRPKQVWVFGADTSWGKSSQLLMVADENIKRGRRVLIVSGEDPSEIYADRLLVRRSGDAKTRINTYRMQHNLLDEDERRRVIEVASRAEDEPVYFEAMGKSVEWVCKRLRRIVPEEGIDLIAFDYLQAFDQEKPQNDRRLQLNYICRTMTDTIKELGTAGIIYSQITPPDEGKGKGGGVPGKYSIRDSKDVSNGAEVIAIGFEPAKDMTSKEGRLLAAAGTKVIHLAKNKPGPGPKGKLYQMNWDGAHGCFDVVEDPMSYQHPEDFDDITKTMHWQDGDDTR